MKLRPAPFDSHIHVMPFNKGTIVTKGPGSGEVILPKDPPIVIPGSISEKGEIVAPLPSIPNKKIELVNSTPISNPAEDTANAALETIKKQHEARDHGTDRKL